MVVQSSFKFTDHSQSIMDSMSGLADDAPDMFVEKSLQYIYNALMTGGEGMWEAAPFGQGPLPLYPDSKALINSIKSEQVDPDTVRVYQDEDEVVYGPIHEFGGTIEVSPEMQVWLLANLGVMKMVGDVIVIPARPYFYPSVRRARADVQAMIAQRRF